MVIWHDKKKPWRHVSTRVCNYQKPLFFHFSKRLKTRKTKVRRLPKYHVWFNFFLFSFWRDNSNLRIGIGLGKKQYSINFHCIF